MKSCRLKHNLEGKRFGHFVVLERFVDRTKSMTQWKCLCDCGSTKVMTGWVLRNSKSNPPVNCGCLRSVGRPKIKKYDNPTSISYNSLWNRYKASAKRRKLQWALSKSEFKTLVRAACEYCGDAPSHEFSTYAYYKSTSTATQKDATIFINGVDRVDNNSGYTLDNCVTACTRCNFAKRDMSREEFLEWIQGVYYHSCNKKDGYEIL